MTGSIWGTHFTDLVQIRLKEHEDVVSVWTFIVRLFELFDWLIDWLIIS
jgi:hypothetical protein